MYLVLIGPPGSGKGTIAGLIQDGWKLPHISTGDLLRAELEKDSPLANQIRDVMSSGQLVSDAIVTQLLANRMDEEDCQDGFMLDGYPRNLAQAETLHKLMDERGIALDHAIHVTVPTETIVTRLETRRVCKNCGATYNTETKPPQEEGVCDVCGGKVVHREDDKAETVRNRLDVYGKKTEPVLEYYRSRHLLRTLDNSGSLEDAEKQLGDIL